MQNWSADLRVGNPIWSPARELKARHVIAQKSSHKGEQMARPEIWAGCEA
jgi:hypothetical protein